MKIEFNESTHQYFLENQELKSVTQLLKEYNLTPRFWSNKAATRGTYVHKAIYLYLLNNLDEESLDPVIKPYFESFKKFWEAQETETWEAEEKVASLLWGIAGTLDWYGSLNEEITIIDFKTSQEVNDSAFLQLELYKRLLETESRIFNYKTKVLHITPDKAELVEQDEKDRERTNKVVDAILTLESFKRRKK